MPNPILWKPPKNECSAKISGLSVPKPMVVSPGQDVTVKVATLCGKETCEMVVSPTETTTVGQLLRQSEIAASIQHVERRACDHCRERFFHDLDQTEKAWLYASDPKLGPVLGIGVGRGVEGTP